MKWLLSGQWVKSILQQQQISLRYGTGYTGSAVKFRQDNHKRLCSNQSHLPLSVISTFLKVFFFLSWTLQLAVLSVDRPCDTPAQLTNKVEGNLFHSFVVVNTAWVCTNAVVCFLNKEKKKMSRDFKFSSDIPTLTSPVASYFLTIVRITVWLAFPSSEKS